MNLGFFSYFQIAFRQLIFQQVNIFAFAFNLFFLKSLLQCITTKVQTTSITQVHILIHLEL